MFYNQNFGNSYDFDSGSNNREKDEKRDCKKGYCTVKVIQECCYPSYFDYEEKNDDKRNNFNYQEDKKYDSYDYNDHDKKDDKNDENHYWRKEEKKEEHNCCCKKEDKWEDKNSCHNNHENNKCCCKQRNSCCGIYSCFRRW